MESAYEIYDDESGNLVGSFPSEQAALAVVRNALKRNGAESVATWSLGSVDLAGDVLRGEKLNERAKHVIVQ